MRLLVFAGLSLLLAGCASSKVAELRGPTPEEKAKVDAALTPLIQASGLCNPKEP